jgi:hypothetical protein
LNSSAPYFELLISGNSIVRFFDHSSVYFGDYHRVKLEARCEFELPGGQEARTSNLSGKETLLNPALFTRTLERMAVPSASVEEVKGALIEDFRKNALPYLSSPDFPLKLIAGNRPVKASVIRKYQAS